MQVHTKRRNRLLHERMRDLVYVKFNSKLRQKKDNKDRDPLENPVFDGLEDEDNEWITGTEPIEVDSEQEGENGASSQGVAAAQSCSCTSRTRKKERVGRGRGLSLPLLRMISYLLHLLMEKIKMPMMAVILVLILRLNDVVAAMIHCV
jgi:hypothetical protein